MHRAKNTVSSAPCRVLVKKLHVGSNGLDRSRLRCNVRPNQSGDANRECPCCGTGTHARIRPIATLLRTTVVGISKLKRVGKKLTIDLAWRRHFGHVGPAASFRALPWQSLEPLLTGKRGKEATANTAVPNVGRATLVGKFYAASMRVISVRHSSWPSACHVGPLCLPNVRNMARMGSVLNPPFCMS